MQLKALFRLVIIIIIGCGVIIIIINHWFPQPPIPDPVPCPQCGMKMNLIDLLGAVEVIGGLMALRMAGKLGGNTMG